MDAIAKIHEFERFGSILGLERISTLMHLLGNPQDELKYIHVAGTNGKGSVSRYLYSTLVEAGYSTGIYISPFIEKFNERIELNGEYISDEDLQIYTDKVLAQVRVMTDRGEDSPTEFEVITAVAFLYFKEKGAEVVVLEVGLGGIGDSTNVIKSPLASVITSISYDHTDRLGNTLAEIASNKAGIIKDGCPIITSCTSEEALAVIEKTAEEHDSQYFETRHLPVETVEETMDGTVFNVMIQGVRFDGIGLCMVGRHQIENAVCALATLCIIEETGALSIPREAIYRGFADARQPGRFEKVNGIMKSESACDVILDGAHNQDGARTLRENMNRLYSGKKVLMLTGMLGDKDIDGAVSEFTEITKDFIVTEPPNPRKMSAYDMAALLRERGCRATAFRDYHDALDMALAAAKDYDVVLMTGSLYLIGALRACLHE